MTTNTGEIHRSNTLRYSEVKNISNLSIYEQGVMHSIAIGKDTEFSPSIDMRRKGFSWVSLLYLQSSSIWRHSVKPRCS